MSEVLVIRKQDAGAVQTAFTSQGIAPQINLSGGSNIPISSYFRPYDSNLGYTGQRPDVQNMGTTDEPMYNFAGQNYADKNQAQAAYNQAPEYNLTTAGKVAGAATTALPAAWSFLSALSDDSQGDVFSAAGRGALGAQATRATLGGAERAAANLGNTVSGKFTNFRNPVAGSSSGDGVAENAYEAESGKEADGSMHLVDDRQSSSNSPSSIGAMVGVVDKIKPPDTNKQQSVIDGQRAESANEKQLRIRQEPVEEAENVMRDNALKSVRHWSYY